MTAENKFDLSYSNINIPDIDSGLDTINPDSIDSFLLIEQAFYGTEGFKSGKYLIPHSREIFYNKRRQYSAYVNFIRPIIKAMYEPCFNEEIQRDHNNDMFLEFEKNCSGNNIPLTKFVKLCLRYIRLQSVVFIVVDNKNQEGLQSRDEAIKQKAIPYCYIKKAYEVNLDGIQFDAFGKLLSIMFFEKMEADESNNTHYFYRYWDAQKSILYKKNKDVENSKSFIEKYTKISETIHGLGELPIAIIYEEIQDKSINILPDPNKLSLVKLNLVIFNQDSERRQVERDQGFSLLTVPSYEGEERDVIAGTNNVVFYPPDSRNIPAYCSSNPDILRALLEQRQTSVETLIATAEQAGVQGITKSRDAKSGLAYAFEFFAYESTLQASSTLAAEVETQIVNLFNLWTKENIEYDIKYPKNFKPNKIQELHLLQNEVIELIGVPNKFKEKIWIEKYKLMYPEDDVGLKELEIELANIKEVEYNQDQKTEENKDGINE